MIANKHFCFAGLAHELGLEWLYGDLNAMLRGERPLSSVRFEIGLLYWFPAYHDQRKPSPDSAT